MDTVQRRPNRQVRLPGHSRQNTPCTRAQTAAKVRIEKRVASIGVCIPRELSYTTGAFRYHCTRGISKNHRYKKRAAQRRCWRAKVWETVRIKKAKSGEYKKEYPPSLWLMDGCHGDRRGEGFPTLAGFVVKGDALHGAAFTCLLSCFPPIFPPRCPAQNTRKTTPSRDRLPPPALPPANTAQRVFPGEAARLGPPPGARLRR